MNQQLRACESGRRGTAGISALWVVLLGALVYLAPPFGHPEAHACHLVCSPVDSDPEPEDDPPPPCDERPACLCESGGGDCGSGSGGGSPPPPPPFGGGHGGNPVSLLRGSKHYNRLDLSVGVVYPITVRRSYDSRSRFDSALGYGWAFHHDRRLFQYPDNSVVIRHECGRRGRFVHTGGTFVTPKGSPQGELAQRPDGSYEFRHRDGGRDVYDAEGYLILEESREGHRHEYVYDPRGKLPLTGTSPYAVDPDRPMTVAYQPRLVRIAERSADGQLTGEHVDFTYSETTGRLQRIETSDGRELTYHHDQTSDDLTRGQLLRVEGLDDLYLAYGYDSPHGQHYLSSNQDGKNSIAITHVYDAEGRVIEQRHGSHVLTFDYLVPRLRTLMTQQVYDADENLLHGASTLTEFNDDGYVTSYVDALGHEVRRIYDGNNDIERLELWRSDNGQPSLVRATNYSHDGQGRPLTAEIALTGGETITRAWSYDHGWLASDQVVSSAEPGRLHRTEYTFHRDSQGRPINVAEVKRRNDDGSFSVTGYSYCTAADVAQPNSICPFERLLKAVDGPRTDVNDITAYAYHPDTNLSGCDSDGPCHRKGQLWTITNALGQTTTFARYDHAGRVTRIADVNGVSTDLAYHPRGWLLSHTVRDPAGPNDATTAFTYSDTGQPSRLTLPDGSYLEHLYDNRSRLTEIRDNLGNRIVYTLDSAGNRLGEQALDSQGTLRRTRTAAYDPLHRLQQSLSAQQHATVYSYDAAGNRVSSTDPLGRVTSDHYDALDRLIRVVQDDGGLEVETQYDYDALGQLRRVIDPKGLITEYVYDARGNLATLISPDTGTTSYTYDAADNRISQVDARGVTTGYAHDALNRLTAINYPTTSLDVTFQFDQPDAQTGCAGSYPIGRLTSIRDVSGTTSYCYDHRGNVTRKSWEDALSATTLTVWYEYDHADRLAAIAYPSGWRVEYARDAAGRLDAIGATGMSDTHTIVSSTDHLPFGPPENYNFGDGSKLSKVHDQNYWVTDVISPVLAMHLRRDAVGNVDRLGTAPGATTAIEQYQYDPLYRLLGVQDAQGNGVEGYTYDGTGNRLSKSSGLATQLYSYSSDSHRLSGVDGLARAYDPVGNTISDAQGGRSYIHDDRNRLVTYSSAQGEAQYRYSGLGERVRKQVTVGLAQETILFFYDEAGQLLGEYRPNGSPVQEYVWADQTPVAVLRTHPILEQDEIYYVHSDHLDTPRAIRNAVGGTVWRWSFEANPFGEQPADEQPELGLPPFRFNLRFPGQYFDAESGLYYNYFRDYEPNIGRYVQADPIHLDGGIALYEYSFSSPLNFIDRFGEEPHRRNKRESNREQHEEGDARRKRDRGNEAADERRRPPRKRPKGFRGKWPEPKGLGPLPIIDNIVQELCQTHGMTGPWCREPPPPDDFDECVAMGRCA